MVVIPALPACANSSGEDNLSGKIKETIEYNSEGKLTDKTKLTINLDLSEKTTTEIALTLKNVLSNEPFATNIEGTMSFTDNNGGVITLGGDLDLLTYDSGLMAKYIGLKLGDNGNLDSKVKIVFPAETWYFVSTLTYNLNEDLSFISELRLDSDGAELYSAEAQLKYAVNDNIDIMVGAELNDWVDGINDWGACKIDSNISRVYTEIVVKF